MNPHIFGKLLLVLQFGLLAVLTLLCANHAADQPPGLLPFLMWIASAALGVWTLTVNRPGNFNIRPEPKTEGHLVKTGPYRWVRHPMYSSVLLLAAGASAWLMSLLAAVLWSALLAVLIAKATLEEHWLMQRYPEYASYRAGTWRLLPWVF